MATFVPRNPKEYKKDPITIRVSYSQLDKIDKLSAKYNISRNACINQCIEFALEYVSDQKTE